MKEEKQELVFLSIMVCIFSLGVLVSLIALMNQIPITLMYLPAVIFTCSFLAGAIVVKIHSLISSPSNDTK